MTVVDNTSCGTDKTLRIDALDIYNSTNGYVYRSYMLRSMGLTVIDYNIDTISHDSVWSIGTDDSTSNTL